MDRKKIADLVRSESKWAEITPPADLHSGIMNSLRAGRYYRKAKKTSTIIRWVAGAAMAASVLIAVLLNLKPAYTEINFAYPYNGENKVELVGSFNNWNERIPMKLDTGNRVWKAVIRLEKKGVYEYQFIINDCIYTAGSTPDVVSGQDGEKKALLIL